MHVLIIGASGFAGTALIDYLTDIKGLDITAMVHKTPVHSAYGNIRYVQSSLHKLPELLPLLGDLDYIFHLARIPGKKWGNAGRIIAGVKGAIANKKLLRALRRTDSKPRLVYLSGSLMYGHNPGKVSVETDPLRPTGFAKYYYLAERPLLQAIANGHNNIVMLRAPWIIGQGSWFEQLYVQHIRKQKSVPAYGDMDRRMSIITLEDCARMLWHYAVNAPASGVCNVYTFGNVPYRVFIESISNAFQQAAIEHYDQQTMLQMTDKATIGSICCEVLLDTAYTDLLNSYKPLFGDLDIYLAQLAKKYG